MDETSTASNKTKTIRAFQQKRDKNFNREFMEQKINEMCKRLINEKYKLTINQKKPQITYFSNSNFAKKNKLYYSMLPSM